MIIRADDSYVLEKMTIETSELKSQITENRVPPARVNGNIGLPITKRLY